MSAKPTTNLLSDYAGKVIEELDVLTQQGLIGISAVGNDPDASPAVIIFSGDMAGRVFVKVLAAMRELDEYQDFIDITENPGARLDQNDDIVEEEP